MGDPIEAHALAEALCVDRPADAPLPIGSVKTNLGHLETAAGVAGLVKAVLVLKHGQIPASLHFKTPSPHIDFDRAEAARAHDARAVSGDGTARAWSGVNSFGFGGANAHVILEEPPATSAARSIPRTHTERAWPLVLSARSEDALRGSRAATLARVAR